MDYEEFIVELGKRILTKAGYRVLTAGTGTEALELFGQEEVFLVILDLVIPEVGGKPCLQEVL